ncbi:hypothetical protein BGW80DRAFT_1252824 [Lactifluus volemus]|nr:hypothetical protein BGW80DRAFT_1252824 [Lactifluus volemus]
MRKLFTSIKSDMVGVRGDEVNDKDEVGTTVGAAATRHPRPSAARRSEKTGVAPQQQSRIAYPKSFGQNKHKCGLTDYPQPPDLDPNAIKFLGPLCARLVRIRAQHRGKEDTHQEEEEEEHPHNMIM